MTPSADPPPTTAAATAAATRRGLLLGGAGLGLLLAGCSTGGGASPTAERSLSPATTASVGGAPNGTDDADRVGEAREALAAVATLVTVAQRSVPSLRAVLAPLLALHEAHAAALGRPLDLPRPARRAAPPDPLLALVRDREEQLQVRLADLAVGADSGALARLLASMSAGLAQRLAVLPVTAPVVPGRRGDA